MYPAGAPPDTALTDAWTWDGFLVAAEKCAKAGFPFGMPLSTWSDSVNWVSAVFAAQGAQLVDEEGNITVKSDEVKEVLGWFKKIVPSLPPSVFAWDNAANNKWLISGQGALIMNPPGAWAVAVRDAPKVAEQLWTFHSPNGPKGRYDPCSFGFWGIWNFSTKALLGVPVAAIDLVTGDTDRVRSASNPRAGALSQRSLYSFHEGKDANMTAKKALWYPQTAAGASTHRRRAVPLR
jgi:ABC-type glycerol-3-phosphate transport system substrate-binding protein